ALSADVRVATIIQTSPVAGVSVDVRAVAAAIRAAAPDCFLIVDGIQHAPHGRVDIGALGIDAYAVSGYKVFSKHNYGFAWVSPRLANLPHDKLDGTADDHWELGTRDAAAYAAFSEVASYLDWLGAHFTASADRRARLRAAGEAIAAHEKHLIEVMLHGGGGQKGLAAMPQVFIIAGAANPRREGLVSLAVRGMPSAQVVAALSARGVRVHIRKNDYFSANILDPLGMTDCVRVSMCHYNSAGEVMRFLRAMGEIIAA
ncbi:MAG: aminotransferase class V-fold PLP-dependent enzyme, partial [Gammaproteobacteria bacterium]